MVTAIGTPIAAFLCPKIERAAGNLISLYYRTKRFDKNSGAFNLPTLV
jgi:hypothetical protein